MILLSLCIPTNGIIEWVFPVLDKIYSQKADTDLFEVIVTDNGENQEFYNRMTLYSKDKPNLVYKKTKAPMFENQIEALRLASGQYLKFINHRSIMEPGSLRWMIELVCETMQEKPIMYLSNGALKYSSRRTYSDFDGFVCGLREYASWTTGVGVWRTDFNNISVDKAYNKISPHSDVLFAVRKNRKYIIDDTIWSHDIDNSHIKKGRYDLYKAFGIEEISITLQLYIDGDICLNTLKCVIKAYENCVAGFYTEFNILHEPCSYIIDGFNDAMGVFLSKRRVLARAYMKLPGYIISLLFRRLKG